MTNAFTIPKKSAVIEGDRRTFRAVVKRFPRNMPETALPGSSKYPAPQMQRKESRHAKA